MLTPPTCITLRRCSYAPSTVIYSTSPSEPAEVERAFALAASCAGVTTRSRSDAAKNRLRPTHCDSDGTHRSAGPRAQLYHVVGGAASLCHQLYLFRPWRQHALARIRSGRAVQ